MEPRRILIVANQTALGPHLKRVVRDKMGEGPAAFTVLVPASAPGNGSWSEGEARAAAEARMNDAVTALRAEGADVEGMVGDHRPIHTITDALVARPHDEIIVSTFPAGMSRWLKQDLPRRVEKVFRLPTTHVVAQPATKS